LLFASLVSAEVCEVDRIKQVLKKILFLYFTEPESVPLTKDEVKDMLVFYLSINNQDITVDCSTLGSRSNKPISDVVNAGDNVADKVPSCADGTKYGECSKFRPAYCYAGAIYSKCDLCGCPTNSVCGKSNKCETTSQNITCFKDIDCSQASFTGSYYCVNNYITRNYLNYSCVNPGTTSSRCDSANGTPWLTYCDPTLNQACIAGQNICKTTINDSAPTVAIVVAPKIAVQGQSFNVTVTGTDDVGLTAIWWWATDTTDTELNKAHWYSCNGAKICKNTWIVSTNASGAITLGANSRDTAYPTIGQPHQASEGQGIAYDTIAITTAPITIGTITIKGRLIDYFTQNPVANALVYTWDGQIRKDVYTDVNGNFATTADTSIITQASSKPFGINPSCYDGIGFAVFRSSDNSLYVNVQIESLIGAAKQFSVTSSEVNLGDIPMWPAVDIAINSDIAVKFSLEYSSVSGGGNSDYKTSHYLSYSIPLNTDVKVKLTDQSGNNYYSPSINLPLSHGCAPVRLDYSNSQFAWNTTPQTIILNQTNQTTLKGYAQTCTNGIECKSLLACISDPLDNNVGKCGWWGAYENVQQCSAAYYPSYPCMCGNITIYAGACNHGIFYYPPTLPGSSIGSSCTDGTTQCSTGICIFGLCSYAVRCSPSTPGYCHNHEECVAYGASC